MRLWLLVVLAGTLVFGSARVASAQAAAPAAPAAAGGSGTTVSVTPATPQAPVDRDHREGSGSGMALLFWGCALLTIGGAIFVISRKNLIAAVMGMVATFFGIAALYMMLFASFLAVVQMLVYAGAIMVLFVFVIMILNRPEDEPWALTGLPGKVLAGIAMLYLTVRLGQTLWDVKPPQAALGAPAPVTIKYLKDGPAIGPDGQPILDDQGKQRMVPVVDPRPSDWGSVAAVGDNLFDEYLFPFEAVSILLLIGVVGAIAVARPFEKEGEGAAVSDDAEEPVS